MDLLPSQVDSSPCMEVQGFPSARLKVLTPIRIRYVPDCVPPRPPLVCVTCESASKEFANSGGEAKSSRLCRVFARGGAACTKFLLPAMVQ